MNNLLTFGMIKPDAVRSNHIGEILVMIEQSNFLVQAISMVKLTPEQVASFYLVHADRPFYKDLCAFISSGPVVAMALKKEDAVLAFRKLMGATNPAEAAEGTIRKAFGQSIDYNAIHGSDSEENAKQELSFFFSTKSLI